MVALTLCGAAALAFALAPTLRPLPPPACVRTAGPPRLALGTDDGPMAEPRDELKSRFSRGESETKTAFTPDSAKKAGSSAPAVAAEAAASATPVSKNAQLLAEIRALQPEPLPPKPEKQKIDLNGIKPSFLLLGASSYGAFSVFAWWFTTSAAEYFAANPFESSFYVVQRLSGIARVVVVSLGSLGTGITGFAALGQLALCAQVVDGINKGELDPNAPRVDPYGGRKAGDLQKMLSFMLGDAKLDELEQGGSSGGGGGGGGGSA